MIDNIDSDSEQRRKTSNDQEIKDISDISSSVAHDDNVVNDFIIPACKKEDRSKHAGRQFQIRFD